VKNYKSILIAGAVAVGLYLFLHSKKILPMTLAQKAAWHEKVSRRMAQMSTAEKIRALKAARKEKAAAQGTPETETTMTLAERMAAIRAAAEEKVSEEEQGTGFDYIRERAPYNIAVPVEKRKHASILKSAERIREEKRRREERIADEQEEEKRKRTEAQKAYRDELRKNLKPKDQGHTKKKTTEDVLKDLGLWALPRTDVEHTQEPEEEPKKQKSTDLGYSKKKTTEDVLKDFGLWALH